jgi:hypothetical protein
MLLEGNLMKSHALQAPPFYGLNTLIHLFDHSIDENAVLVIGFGIF